MFFVFQFLAKYSLWSCWWTVQTHNSPKEREEFYLKFWNMYGIFIIHPLSARFRKDHEKSVGDCNDERFVKLMWNNILRHYRTAIPINFHQFQLPVNDLNNMKSTKLQNLYAHRHHSELRRYWKLTAFEEGTVLFRGVACHWLTLLFQTFQTPIKYGQHHWT